MNGRTLEKMQYFVGKVCSIVTSSMNRTFDEQVNREHFVIMVEELTADGIWGTHPYNDELVSFFCMNHIISIHEEFELDPNNPEHAEMIKEYEEKSGKKLEGDIRKPKTTQEVLKEVRKENGLNIIESNGTPLPDPEPDDGGITFVDISSLEKLAAHTKKTFDAKDLLG
ncbi:hypothetical protein IID24_05560 [Patescibacteria group bacterium]|nr:hypothetical protein [Patescibacteria group bacterium]